MAKSPRKTITERIILVAAGILGFGVSLIPLIRTGLPLEYLIAIMGFLVLWGTTFISIIYQHDETLDRTTQHNTSVDSIHSSTLAILNLEHQLHQNHPQASILEKLATKYREASGNIHSLTQLDVSVNRFLETTTPVNGTLRIDFVDETELDRKQRLRSIIKHAERYVRAVTYDSGDYVREFWTDADPSTFSRQYWYAHKTYKSKISRALILGSDVFDWQAPNKSELVQRIVQTHTHLGIALKLYRKEDIPEDWEGHNLSFIVSDDYVTGEARVHADGSTKRFITLGDPREVAKLLELFSDLDRFKTTKWSFRNAAARKRLNSIDFKNPSIVTDS